MDAMAVNWGVLDKMVVEYCKAEGLVEDPESNTLAVRDAIKQIRSLIERGCITEAVGLITERAAVLLKDQRILFWLYKQNFIEMLRSGGPAARSQAIECSRAQLGPCALDAYPEAYEEFKRILLVLIYDRDYQNSPVAEEWSEARRADLAATVASTLRAHLHVHDPLFSLTLRYLISIHNAYCIRRNVASPIGDVASDILLKDRDPPPALQDSFAEAPNFNEVDVQALAQAAELPREAAVQSLKYTRGDVMAALKNELCRIRTNTVIVDKLVWEYCLYRGLIDSGMTKPVAASTEPNILQPQNNGSGFQSNGKGDVSKGGSNESVVGEQSNDAQIQAVQSQKMEEVPPVAEDRVLPETAADCCTSNSCEGVSSEGKMKQYRWRGRVPIVCGDSVFDRPSQSTGTQEVVEDIEMVPADKLEPADAAFEKYRRSLKIRQLITERKIPEAIKEVQHLDPSFFDKHPQLLFQVKQIEFCGFVEAGDQNRALELARTDMGPLAAQYAELLKPLKETLLGLACALGETPPEQIVPAGLAASVQVALSASLGITDPQLMKIMRACLFAHTEWFKVQMCSDPFADLLNINELKENESVVPKVATKKTESGNAGEQPGISKDGPPFDESSILTIMEWMALPRGDAIQLLAEYDSVEEVFAQLMG